MTESGLVVAHNQKSDTNAGLNPSQNNLSAKDTPYTGIACDKESNVEKAKKQIGDAFGCLLLLPMGEPTYYDKIPDIIDTHRLVRQSGVSHF